MGKLQKAKEHLASRLGDPAVLDLDPLELGRELLLQSYDEQDAVASRDLGTSAAQAFGVGMEPLNTGTSNEGPPNPQTKDESIQCMMWSGIMLALLGNKAGSAIHTESAAEHWTEEAGRFPSDYLQHRRALRMAARAYEEQHEAVHLLGLTGYPLSGQLSKIRALYGDSDQPERAAHVPTVPRPLGTPPGDVHSDFLLRRRTSSPSRTVLGSTEAWSLHQRFEAGQTSGGTRALRRFLR